MIKRIATGGMAEIYLAQGTTHLGAQRLAEGRLRRHVVVGRRQVQQAEGELVQGLHLELPRPVAPRISSA